MMSQLAAHHPTNRVDEIPTVQVFEPILIRIVGVGTAVELVGRRVFNPVFIMSILGTCQNTCNDGDRRLTRYSSSLNMKGVMAQLALVR